MDQFWLGHRAVLLSLLAGVPQGLPTGFAKFLAHIRRFRQGGEADSPGGDHVLRDLVRVGGRHQGGVH